MRMPFGLTLAGLTLKGKDRRRAEARYNLVGEELDRVLLSIDYDTEVLRNTDEYKLKKLEIDKKYQKINDLDYELNVNDVLEKDDTKKKLKRLDILKKYGKMDTLEYNKRYNDMLGKPWVAIKTNYDEDADPDNLEIEVAYNNTFITNMRKKGLPGETDEEIAEQWLRLFLIANLEEDDLDMVRDNDSEDDKPSVSKKKIGDNATFIS